MARTIQNADRKNCFLTPIIHQYTMNITWINISNGTARLNMDNKGNDIGET